MSRRLCHVTVTAACHVAVTATTRPSRRGEGAVKLRHVGLTNPSPPRVPCALLAALTLALTCAAAALTCAAAAADLARHHDAVGHDEDEHRPVEPWPAHARWARVGARACLPCPATEPAAALPQRGHATGAAGANARAPSSARQQPLLVPRLHPRGAPLDQSDEEGAHRVVDLHEAPRHPSVDASGRSGLLRRRIFPCGHHRVPDHLREREPPLTRMNHRLRRSRCLLVAPAALPLEGFQHPRSERFGRKRS